MIDNLPKPISRVEHYLKAIAVNGSSDGTGMGKDGKDGREIELQSSTIKLQWRYQGDTVWIDLIDLHELRGTISEWMPNTDYLGGDVIIAHDSLYRAKQDHISSSTFAEDMTSGVEQWRLIGAGASSGASNTYKQVTKFGVIAPMQVDISISNTDLFCLPAVEILKFVSEATKSTISIKNETAKFERNETYVFGDAVKLKTAYIIPAQTVVFADGYVSESGEFDFKKIEKVEVV